MTPLAGIGLGHGHTGQKTTSSLPDHLSLSFLQHNPLDAQTRIVVQQRTSEIKTLMRRAASDIFDIGQKLTEVKQQLGHGSFMNWLKSEFNWSGSTATRFMQVSEQFKFVNLVNADIAASALYELAAPSTPLEAIERALKGEPITYSQAKEIAKRYQELSQIENSEPVTIDIDAEIVGAESSAAKQHQLQLFGKEVEPQLTPHLEASSSIQVSASDQTKTISSSTLTKKG